MTQKIRLALKELRKRKQMTQKELADIMNVSFQTISKWENGKALPDISYLPALAKCFDVELEVLLGMKSVEEDELEHYTQQDYWKCRMECTKDWKIVFYNEDYFAFLVRDVWKIDRPVKILDCACGYGYLGLLLLPLLPKGSTYTGVDICETYLREGERLFGELPYQVNFVQGDILEYETAERYDMVISQIFLSYVSEPEKVLVKMKRALRPGGMLLVMDDNVAMIEASTFIGTDRGEVKKDIPDPAGVWKYSERRKEFDWRMGTKLPWLFHKLGMERIGARMSDRIFLSGTDGSPGGKEDLEKYKNIVSNFDRVKEGYSYYLKRGCSWQEAKRFVQYQEAVQEALQDPAAFVSRASCVYIVWGFRKAPKTARR